MRDEQEILLVVEGPTQTKETNDCKFFYLIVTAGTIENWEEYWNEWN